MRKNRMMRLASALLVLTMLTTCAISGTFAKYVTQDTASDSARVAKWGVKVIGTKGDGNQMFSKEYSSDTGDYAGVTVASSVNVVAPGTEGTFSKFEVTGTTEVATRVTYTPTVTLNGDWTDGSEYYCPLVVNVGTAAIAGLDYNSIDQFKAAIEAAVIAAKADYAPGTDLSAVNDDLSISWSWPFETGANDGEKAENNIKDTALGKAAVTGDLTISISVDCTISQID